MEVGAVSTQDAINAGIEVLGTFMVLVSVRRLVRDKKVRGIAPSHVAYSVGSAWWFTYYYAHLDQWLSFAAAVAYTLVVSFWMLMMVVFFIREILFDKGSEL
jgi:hypothetical protein